MQPLLTAYLGQTSVEIFKSTLSESMRGPCRKIVSKYLAFRVKVGYFHELFPISPY